MEYILINRIDYIALTCFDGLDYCLISFIVKLKIIN